MGKTPVTGLQQLMPTEVIAGQTTFSALTAVTFPFQGAFSCTIKHRRIPSSAALVEGCQGRSGWTHAVRGDGASSNHKQGPGRSLEHPGPRLEVPMEMPSFRKCWGRDEMHQAIPRANTNEHINERIKKGWGRVSPTPSPAVIAPVLRGVASFG